MTTLSEFPGTGVDEPASTSTVTPQALIDFYGPLKRSSASGISITQDDPLPTNLFSDLLPAAGRSLVLRSRSDAESGSIASVRNYAPDLFGDLIPVPSNDPRSLGSSAEPNAANEAGLFTIGSAPGGEASNGAAANQSSTQLGIDHYGPLGQQWESNDPAGSNIPDPGFQKKSVTGDSA